MKHPERLSSVVNVIFQKKKSPLLISPVTVLSNTNCASLLNGTYTLSSSQACLQPSVSSSKSCLVSVFNVFIENNEEDSFNSEILS